ncbi:MAG: chloride channel protein, partial [Victivallales bacterium]|nr:chloride channel protein [Victivallales bacterium]
MFAQRIWDCFRRAFLRILVFSYYHLGENGVLILLGVVTGLITGVGVGAMKSIAGYFSELALLLNQYGWSNATFALPAVGLFGAFWVGRLLLRKHHSSNLSWVIYDLQKQHPKMSWQETFSHIFTGAITVGLGGSSGLETPSVLTGGAIGDKTGEFCRLTSEDRNMLMVCGTAAGISAVFGSPIAGVLFALEVVFPRQERRRLVPILLASAGAAIIDRAIFGGNRYMFQVSIGAWTIGSLLYFVVLGVVCAFVGVYTIRVNYRLGEFLKRMFPHRILRLGIGCIGLAGLLALFPILAGDGYKFVQMLFSGVENSALSSWNYSWNILFLASAVVLLKIVATVFTLECGGDGGIFAPTIFIGAFTGFLLARTISAITGIPLSDTNFVLAGMCGVFTAALRAPLTGIFLIVEVTGAFGMTVPLMIVAGFSYFTAIFFEPYSIYTKVLGMRHLLEPTPDERSSRRQ